MLCSAIYCHSRDHKWVCCIWKRGRHDSMSTQSSESLNERRMNTGMSSTQCVGTCQQCSHTSKNNYKLESLKGRNSRQPGQRIGSGLSRAARSDPLCQSTTTGEWEGAPARSKGTCDQLSGGSVSCLSACVADYCTRQMHMSSTAVS